LPLRTALSRIVRFRVLSSQLQDCFRVHIFQLPRALGVCRRKSWGCISRIFRLAPAVGRVEVSHQRVSLAGGVCLTQLTLEFWLIGRHWKIGSTKQKKTIEVLIVYDSRFLRAVTREMKASKRRSNGLASMYLQKSGDHSIALTRILTLNLRRRRHRRGRSGLTLPPKDPGQ